MAMEILLLSLARTVLTKFFAADFSEDSFDPAMEPDTSSTRTTSIFVARCSATERPFTSITSTPEACMNSVSTGIFPSTSTERCPVPLVTSTLVR